MQALCACLRGAANLDRTRAWFLYCPMGCGTWGFWRTAQLLATAFVLIILPSACSSKTIAYPEDHERILRIDAALGALRNAYQDRDLSAFESLLLPSNDMDQLKLDVSGDFDAFQNIALNFAAERILIDGDNVDVFVHWEGQWAKEAGSPGSRQRGHARLQWVGNKSILLKAVQGDLPFGMRHRRTSPLTSETRQQP